MFRRNATLAKAFIAALSATMLSMLVNIASNDIAALQKWNWVIWPLILLLVALTLLMERERRTAVPLGGSAVQATAERLEGLQRAHMIVRVRSSWITGVLGQSLHAAARTVVASPCRPLSAGQPVSLWNLVYIQGETVEIIAAKTPIVDIFERKVGGALLIEGGPGSGKTTLLLQLASDLLDLAETEPLRPIPVVFKLASWTPSRSLHDWLVDELQKLYDVPPNLGRNLIESVQVMPLLDGLDELQSENRARCVKAINSYRDQLGMQPLAVTIRSDEYRKLSPQLRVQGTIRVDPPNMSQIVAYLDEVGIQDPHIRAALNKDPQKLASPLVLNIVALAYQRRSGADLFTDDNPEAWRPHLFRVYVDQMLRRDDQPASRDGHPTRGNPEWYPQEDVERYLGWLAHVLRRYPQGTFRLDSLQPWWLPSQRARLCATWGLSLAAAVVATTIVSTAAYLIYEKLNPHLGLAPRQPLLGIPAWLVAGIGIGVGVGFFAYGNAIRPAYELRWSWRELRRQFPGRMPVGVLLGVIAGAVAWSQDTGPQRGPLFGLATALLALALFTAIGGFAGGLREERVSPNEGMRRARRMALLGSLPFALPFGALTAVLYGLAYNPIVGMAAALHTTLAFWVVAGLWAGGRDYLQHLTVRALLHRSGLAPWQYMRFLDYAVRRLVLQQVGLGYQFMHPELLDYFADRNSCTTRSQRPQRLSLIGRTANPPRWLARKNITELFQRG